MLNQELELSLNMAFARAREHRHEFMTVECRFNLSTQHPFQLSL
ncbi:ATP-dependent Clp protease ATP-binding subunit ClpA [Serratia marcescens]|nr:ATP-dependent Clp protease ATP-binding subunit ClpA [Serratia marcescens]